MTIDRCGSGRSQDECAVSPADSLCDQVRGQTAQEGKILYCESGSCDACLALDGKTYRLDKPPELPYKNCTCELGCRCLANAVLDF